MLIISSISIHNELSGSSENQHFMKKYRTIESQNNINYEINDLFNNHYTDLCRKALRVVNDKDISEDILQDVFFKFWQKKENINISTSLIAYLSRMVFNESISCLRKNTDYNVLQS